MEIAVRNLQKKVHLRNNKIKSIVRRILKTEKVTDACLSILFVNHQTIRGFNQKYLKRNYATDVLAFDHTQSQGHLHGDVIISMDAAIRQAKEYKNSLSREIILYLIHGILHLTGYDDHKADDTKKMRKREEALLNALGKADKIIR